MNEAPPAPAKSPPPGVLHRPIKPALILTVVDTFLGMVIGVILCWVLTVVTAILLSMSPPDPDGSFIFFCIVAVALLGAFLRQKFPDRALGAGVILACGALALLFAIVD